jgi:PTH1 family peptidyl-tRNA hydrolase
MRYYKVQPEQIIVAHDELDFPLGTLRLKTGGGAAGHNGVRSVIQHCGPQIGRLRLGIGATAPKQLDSGAEYVLGKFTNLEMAAIPAVMLKAAKAIELILEHGWAHAMQLVHRQEKG